MPNGSPGWDATTVYYYIDVTTKLTVLYLVVSVIALLSCAIRLLPMLKSLRASIATSRKQNVPNNDRFEPSYARVQAAVSSLRKWSQLTVLVLLAYSATELASLFTGISLSKMTGVSALAGEWAAIFSMWTFASWFLVALCLSSWFLRNRLARYDDAVSRFSPRDDARLAVN
jgi:hypothetical protein